MMKRGVAGVVAAMVLLAGCGDAESSADETTSSSSPRPERSSSTSSSPSPSPVDPSASSPTSDTSLVVGDVAKSEYVDITVQEVAPQSSPHSQLPEDQKWWGAKVKSCVKNVPDGESGVSFSWLPWSITGNDGGTYPASDGTWGDFPRPAYPFAGERQYRNGQCVNGWIMFALNADVKPATVEYGNNVGEVFSWEVAAS